MFWMVKSCMWLKRRQDEFIRRYVHWALLRTNCFWLRENEQHAVGGWFFWSSFHLRLLWSPGGCFPVLLLERERYLLISQFHIVFSLICLVGQIVYFYFCFYKKKVLIWKLLLMWAWSCKNLKLLVVRMLWIYGCYGSMDAMIITVPYYVRGGNSHIRLRNLSCYKTLCWCNIANA